MITNDDKKQNLETKVKTLVIISGATRGIGKAFADYYGSRDDTTVIGISRSNKTGLTLLNLLDENAVANFVYELDLSRFTDLVYLHGVGIDKFEPDGKPHIDRNCDGIDDEVYDTNVTAFENIMYPLVRKAVQAEKPLTIVNIGSISDVYGVPYWQSFSRSKNKVRGDIKSVVSKSVKGITLNISSTLDEYNYKYGRINADTTYWQTAPELVTRSVESIDGMRDPNLGYAEFDFYKFNPHFREDYFTNLPQLFAIWQRDMGFAGKEVPHGIRI